MSVPGNAQQLLQVLAFMQQRPQPEGATPAPPVSPATRPESGKRQPGAREAEAAAQPVRSPRGGSPRSKGSFAGVGKLPRVRLAGPANAAFPTASLCAEPRAHRRRTVL